MRADCGQRRKASGTAAPQGHYIDAQRGTSQAKQLDKCAPPSSPRPQQRRHTPVIECISNPEDSNTHAECDTCLSSPPLCYNVPIETSAIRYRDDMKYDEKANLYTFSAREIQAAAQAHRSLAPRDTSASYTSSVTVSSLTATTFSASRGRSSSMPVHFTSEHPHTINSASPSQSQPLQKKNNVDSSFLLHVPCITHEACRRTQASLVELADPTDAAYYTRTSCTCCQKEEDNMDCKGDDCGHVGFKVKGYEANNALKGEAQDVNNADIKAHVDSDITKQYEAAASPMVRVPRLPLAQLLQGTHNEREGKQPVYTTTAPDEDDVEEDNDEYEYEEEEEGSSTESVDELTSELSEGAFTQLSYARDSPSPSIARPGLIPQGVQQTSKSSSTKHEGVVCTTYMKKRCNKVSDALSKRAASSSAPAHSLHDTVNVGEGQANVRKYVQTAMLVQSVRHHVRAAHMDSHANSTTTAGVKLTRAATSSAYLTQQMTHTAREGRTLDTHYVTTTAAHVTSTNSHVTPCGNVGDALARWRAKTMTNTMSATNTTTNPPISTRKATTTTTASALVRQPHQMSSNSVSGATNATFTRAATAVTSLCKGSTHQTPRPGFAPVTSRRPVRRAEVVLTVTHSSTTAITKCNALQRTNSRREGLAVANSSGNKMSGTTTNVTRPQPVHLFARHMSSSAHMKGVNSTKTPVSSSPRLQTVTTLNNPSAQVTHPITVKPFARMDSRMGKENAMPGSTGNTPRSTRPHYNNNNNNKSAKVTTPRRPALQQHNVNNADTTGATRNASTVVNKLSVYERLSSDYYHKVALTTSTVYVPASHNTRSETQGRSTMSSILNNTRPSALNTTTTTTTRPALVVTHIECTTARGTTAAPCMTAAAEDTISEEASSQVKHIAKNTKGVARRSTSSAQTRPTTTTIQTVASHDSSRASPVRLSQVTSLTASLVGRTRAQWLQTDIVKASQHKKRSKAAGTNNNKTTNTNRPVQGKRLSQGAEANGKAGRNSAVWQRLQRPLHNTTHPYSSCTPRLSGRCEEEGMAGARRTQPHTLCDCT